MIRAIRCFVLACLLPAISCGETSTETNSNQQPLSCTGNSNLAMIWSTIEQGTFLNPNTLPTPGANWSNYIHPTWPLLSFLHPPDWAPTTLAGGQTVGVDLLRSDGGGIYHNLGSWDMTGIAVTQWLEETINRAFALMNASGNGTVLCSLPSTSRQLAPGVFATVAAAVVVTDDTVVVGSVTLNSINGLNGNNVTITTVGGRNEEFNRIADDVLFPIYFQQLVGRDPLQDTDMDGVPDVNDAAPLDPAVQ